MEELRPKLSPNQFSKKEMINTFFWETLYFLIMSDLLMLSMNVFVKISFIQAIVIVLTYFGFRYNLAFIYPNLMYCIRINAMRKDCIRINAMKKEEQVVS